MQHFRKLMLLLQHESQSKQSSRSNASDHPSLNCLHVRNLLCLEEDLLDRICFTGMSKACFCWFYSLVALFCEWIFSPGACLHVSQAPHCTAHTSLDPFWDVSCVSPVSQCPVVLQCQLSVSTVSKSLSLSATDCLVIFPSSLGSQWMPDSQNW